MRVVRIFGPKRDEVSEDWSILHNEGLHNWYTSQNIIIMVIISRRMSRAEHVATTETTKCLRGCIQKFPDWPPGARTANNTAPYH
jgi:hypothetical protein